MSSINLLDVVGILAGVAHFATPLVYYAYAKVKWLRKPWNIAANEDHRPRVSILIPTYREAGLIERKLDDLLSQDYPKDLTEVLVVDGASDDGTAEIVDKWALSHKDFNLKLVREPQRAGKASALNRALARAAGEVIVTADVDALWPREALRETLKWFGDPGVGAVSCLKKPTGRGRSRLEDNYRHYYNVLRLAESKAYATPVFHGELAAYRRDLLEMFGGFPADLGADDSRTATRIALMGFRAVTPENICVDEIVPREGYSSWRIRRAQHLIQHFSTLPEAGHELDKEFRRILIVESFLHVLNPWLLLASVLLLATSAALLGSLAAIGALLPGLVLLGVEAYRTWVVQQSFLLAASVRNLWSRETVWSKQAK